MKISLIDLTDLICCYLIEHVKDAGIPVDLGDKPSRGADIVVEDTYTGTIPSGAIKTSWLDACIAAGERVGVGSAHRFHTAAENSDEEEEVPVKKTGKKSTAAKATKAKKSARAAVNEHNDESSADAKASGAAQPAKRGRPAKDVGRPAKATAQRKEPEVEEDEESENLAGSLESDADASETVQRLVPDGEEHANGTSTNNEEEEELDEVELAAAAATAVGRSRTARLPGETREANRATSLEVPRLAYEVFMRYGTKMPLWPEDDPSRVAPRRGLSINAKRAAAVAPSEPPRRAGAPRPKFPAQLLNVPCCNTILERNARFRPEEDATLLIWMIRAFPLFTGAIGLTSYQSPCLWHWAQQARLLPNRTWESMKSRARQVLVKYITGASDLPSDLFQLLEQNEYFTFEGLRLVSFNRQAVERDNEASKNHPDAQLYLDQLDPAPDAVPTRKGKRATPDNAEGTMDPLITIDLDEDTTNAEEAFERAVEEDPSYTVETVSSGPNKRRKPAETD